MPETPPPPDSSPNADIPTPEAASARPGGFLLDLSSSEGRASTEPASWKRKRKQASPILTKIVDLSAPPPSKAPKPPAPPPKALPAPRSEKQAGKPRTPRGSGATLADLLDPETLARLRGED